MGDLNISLLQIALVNHIVHGTHFQFAPENKANVSCIQKYSLRQIKSQAKLLAHSYSRKCKFYRLTGMGIDQVIFQLPLNPDKAYLSQIQRDLFSSFYI